MSKTKANSSESVKEESKPNVNWWAERKSNKTIAVGYTPSEVKFNPDTQTVEDVKEAYVCGDIDILTLESKLEDILE